MFHSRQRKIGIASLAMLLFLVIVPHAYSQDIEGLFGEGNRLYQDGAYEEALMLYSQILESGFESGELYYNLGNTYYKIEESGYAVLFYERARRLMPDDDDLLNNIDLISISLADRITPLPELFYVRYWNSFRNMLNMSAWKVLFFVAWILTAINIIILFYVKQKQAQDLVKMGVVTGGIVIVIIAGVFITAGVADKPGMDGVIMMPEVSVTSSPNEVGTEVLDPYQKRKCKWMDRNSTCRWKSRLDT